MARQPVSNVRISGDSLEEIFDELEDEGERLTRRAKIRVRRHKLWRGTLLNVLACWYLSLPREERERIAREGVLEYVRRLESDEPIPLRPGEEHASSGTGTRPGPASPTTPKKGSRSA